MVELSTLFGVIGADKPKNNGKELYVGAHIRKAAQFVAPSWCNFVFVNENVGFIESTNSFEGPPVNIV